MQAHSDAASLCLLYRNACYRGAVLGIARLTLLYLLLKGGRFKTSLRDVTPPKLLSECILNLDDFVVVGGKVLTTIELLNSRLYSG